MFLFRFFILFLFCTTHSFICLILYISNCIFLKTEAAHEILSYNQRKKILEKALGCFEFSNGDNCTVEPG